MSPQMTAINQSQPTVGSTRSRKRLGRRFWTGKWSVGVKTSPSRSSEPVVLSSPSTAADSESGLNSSPASDAPANISIKVIVRVKMALAKCRVQSPATRASTIEALAIATGVLSEVATMTQNVPYIQTVSSLITHIVQVNDDIDLLKSKRKLLRGKVLQLQEIMEDVEERLGPDVDLPMDMQKAFRMLESVLNQVILVLERCFITKKAKLLFARKDIIKDIEYCDEELKNALACFTMSLLTTNTLDTKDIKTNLGIVSEKVDDITVAVKTAVVEMRSQKDGMAGSAAITYAIAVHTSFFFNTISSGRLGRSAPIKPAHT